MDSFRFRLAPLRWVPKHALGVIKEVGRHLLRRPVVGINAVARTAEGDVLLVRRADADAWALPGGTLEWGELLSEALPREVAEETGARWVRTESVSGIYSRPDRDPRFHAVTICVRGLVAGPIRGPDNPLEIREARLFSPSDLPSDWALGMRDMLEDALENRTTPVLE